MNKLGYFIGFYFELFGDRVIRSLFTELFRFLNFMLYQLTKLLDFPGVADLDLTA